MVGAGENKKSMVYIGNIVAFIESCIATNQRYGVYNYVDSPDLTMNELVTFAREKLLGKTNTGMRVPYWLAIMAGYAADIITALSGKKLIVNSIRVKKFAANSEFSSSKMKLEGFHHPTNFWQVSNEHCIVSLSRRSR